MPSEVIQKKHNREIKQGLKMLNFGPQNLEWGWVPVSAPVIRDLPFSDFVMSHWIPWIQWNTFRENSNFSVLYENSSLSVVTSKYFKEIYRNTELLHCIVLFWYKCNSDGG